MKTLCRKQIKQLIIIQIKNKTINKFNNSKILINCNKIKITSMIITINIIKKMMKMQG